MVEEKEGATKLRVQCVEDEALENFAQMAQRLMREPGRKRPQGMPERKSRVVK